MSTVFNIADRLVNLVTGLGTSKDKGVVNAYVATTQLGAVELSTMHRTDWIARKIVDIIPFDMTREWRIWSADKEQITAIEALEKKISLQRKLYLALQIARLFGGAGMYFHIKGQNPATPFDPESVKKDSLEYIHVFTRYQLTAGELYTDPLSPDFDTPIYWQIASPRTAEVRIHPSRIITFMGSPIANPDERMEFWGDSVLQAAYDAIVNASSAQQHVAALLPEAKLDIVKVPNLSEHLSTADGTSRLQARFLLANQMKSSFGMLLLEGTGKEGETWEQKQILFSQFPDLLRQFLEVVSAAADIPVTRMLAQAPAGMDATGESDTRNYYDNVAARQSIELTPQMFPLDEVIIRSSLGSRPEEIFYTWQPLWQMTPVEKSEVQLNKAETAKLHKESGLIPIDALAQSLQNQIIEDMVYPGFEDAMEASNGELPAEVEAENAERALEIEAEAAKNPPAAPSGAGGRTPVRDMAPKPLYVYRKVLNPTPIIRWAAQQGITAREKASELHVTLCYSRQPVDWMKAGESYSPRLEISAGGPRVLEMFGEALVLSFASRELHWRHQDLKSAGAEHAYDNYQPHITISYEFDGDLTKLTPYKGPIILGPEQFEELDEG